MCLQQQEGEETNSEYVRGMCGEKKDWGAKAFVLVLNVYCC